MIQQALLWAAAGTGFTFLMTTIGAAMVFFMKRQSSALMQQIFLGFASGVMIAASIWSLLIPAIDEAAQNGQPGWIPAAGGFILGLVLMLTLGRLNAAPALRRRAGRRSAVLLSTDNAARPRSDAAQHSGRHGGWSVICSCGTAYRQRRIVCSGRRACHRHRHSEFPGRSRSRASAPSGGTQPHALVRLRFAVRHCRTHLGVLVVLCASALTTIMPWLLSAAAGAMLYVVVEELIPEAHLGEHSHPGTLGVMAGFLVMMVLDTALG